MFRISIDPGTNSGVGVAFTDRSGGVSQGSFGPLNLGRTDVDDLAAVETNFERVRRAVGVPRLVTLSQVHSADVVTVDRALLDAWGPRSHLGSPAGERPLPVGDAMVTTEPDVALCIRVADCVPVLLADAEAGVLGAAHAGRVGFLAGVLGNTVDAMQALGARDIVAWIGPHICGPCYEVPQQMAEEVELTHPEMVVTSEWGTPALDLGLGCELDLEVRGVTTVRLDPCTRTSPELHSHRRDGSGAGRLAGMIWRVSRPA